MKILHVASFIGNIGDNASHIGTYRILNKFFDYKVDRLEIRKAYENYTLSDKWKFDRGFVDLANEYDLVLLGGGAFFDYFLDNSATGTTVDITEDTLELLTPEIVVMSMGCLPRGGEHNYGKVSKFLDSLKDRAHIFFRNDGSHYPGIPQVLDSGFFYDNLGRYRPVEGDYIAISVAEYEAGDMESYTDELARLVESIPEKVVFVPHVMSDIGLINRVINKIHFFTVASRVTVAPYQQGWEGCRQLFSVYKNSKQVIATRYHANVCSIAMGKPCVGIGVSPKVDALFGSRSVKITPNMCEELIDRFGETYNIDALKQDTLCRYTRVFGGIT